MIAGLTALSAAFFAGVLGLAVRARRRPVRTGAEEMIGSTGEVVQLGGRRGPRPGARRDLGGAIEPRASAKGQKVRVVGRTGLTLAVEPST